MPSRHRFLPIGRRNQVLDESLADASRIQVVLERKQLQQEKKRKQRWLEFAYFGWVAMLAFCTFASDMNAEARFYQKCYSCEGWSNSTGYADLCDRDGLFFYIYFVHGLSRILVSSFLSFHLIPLLRYYYARISLNTESALQARRASVQKREIFQKHAMQKTAHLEAKVLLASTGLDAAGTSRLDDRLELKEELLDAMKTDKLRMAYLQASFFVVMVDLFGLVLALWRTNVNGIERAWYTDVTSSFFSFHSNKCKHAQGALVLQVLFSALSLAKPKDLMQELKELLRVQLKHARERREAIKAEKQESTEIARFENVPKSAVRTLLRLRELLGNAVKRTARDIAGDAMLLRYLTQNETSTNHPIGAEAKMNANTDDAKVMSAAHVVLEALDHRERCGANAARERILRDDLSYDTVPDADHLQRVFPHNMLLGHTKKGDLLRFEAWGLAKPSEIADKWHSRRRPNGPHSRWSTAWLFLEELQNLNLIELSHRQKVVRQVVLLVDASGMSTRHEKLAQCLRARFEQRGAIYPGMIAEVVVGNASFGDAKVLKRLAVLPKSTVLVNSERELMRRRSSLMISSIRRSSRVSSRSSSGMLFSTSSARSQKFTVSKSSTSAPSVEDEAGQVQNPFSERFEENIIPKTLGGTNPIGIDELCGGVSHDTVNKTLGGATLLRTFEGVTEEEVQLTGELRRTLTEEANVGFAALPQHVGGDVVLLKELRYAENDLGDASLNIVKNLRRRREDFHFDTILQNILECEMSFSDVPHTTELQAVWPHNPDLGRTDAGMVVMYEAWGQIKVDELLRRFPLGVGTSTPQENLSLVVPPEEWVDALLRADGGRKDIAEYLKEFDAVCRSDADDFCRSSEEQFRRSSSSVLDQCTADLNSDGLDADAEESDGWCRIHQQVDGVQTEYRKTKASRFRQLRFSASLPFKIDGQVISAERWFSKAVQWLGTNDSIVYEDSSVIEDVEMERIDDDHTIYWRANTMSRGMRNRDMVVLAHIDREQLTFYAKTVPGLDELVDKSLGIQAQEKGVARAEALRYGFRIVPAEGKGCRFIAFEHINPRGNAPAFIVNRDWVSLGRARGYAEMVDALVERVRDAEAARSTRVGRASTGVSAMSPNAFVENVTHRHELSALLQDRVSREQRRIVRSILVINMHGLKPAHRRIFPYIIKVDAINTASTNFLEIVLNVAANAVVKTLWTAISPMLPEDTKSNICFLRTEGDSYAAKEGRARLDEWVPKRVLPRSLGGTAAFGPHGDCCAAVKHASFLKIRDFSDIALLDSFTDIGPREIAAARRLYLDVQRLHLDIQSELKIDMRVCCARHRHSQPAHILGGVALVRIVLNDMHPFESEVKTMLTLRQKHKCDALHREMLEQRYHLNNLPGSSELQAATYQSNEWLATDVHGSIVSYLRWGAIDPAVFPERISLDRYQSWLLYRFEAISMLLDALSRRSAQVVRYVDLIDLSEASSQHRRVFPYIKEYSFGEATKVTTGWQCVNVLAVNVSRTSARLFSAVKRTIPRKNIHTLEMIVLMYGDPFETSADFEERFARFQLPSSVGNGNLRVGADEHCCLGAELPPMCDGEALWKRYGEMRSSIEGFKALGRKSSSGLSGAVQHAR